MSDEIKVVEDIDKTGAQAPRDIALQGGIDQTALFIQNIDRVFQPCVLDGVSWETERKGAPGKLSFKVLEDEALEFEEGNIVKFGHNGKEVFYGYVFSRKRDKDGVISVTAYDQLRYLKNKDSCSVVEEKASDAIKRLAEDFRLKIGEIEDTKYFIPRYRASNASLFDIMQTCIDITLEHEGKFYVLYDDFGKLCLKDAKNLSVDILIDAATAENFSYETSIDKDTYNRIKLCFDNKETKKREIYVLQDGKNIARWGVLQQCESINSKKAVSPSIKAGALLTLYNHPRKALSVSGALGDDRVRGGSSVYVSLDLGGEQLGTKVDANGKLRAALMLVESAKHRYANNQHTMDLMLRGHGFL